MNRFSFSTYLLILSVLALGTLYSLPNLYPAMPSIQVAYADSGKSADEPLKKKVTTALERSEIEPLNIKLAGNNLMVNLESLDDQLAAKASIQKLLLDDAIVALNLEPSTPQWLKDIGAGPLKLGLDLSGGLRFLLEVDIDHALSARLDNDLNSLRKDLRESNILYTQSISDANSLTFVFEDNITYENALKLINQRNEVGNYVISPISSQLTIKVSYSDAFIDEIKENAISQNRIILNKRVNEIGVSEPIVQREGGNRIVVELPGVQDTTAAKKIIGKTGGLEFRMEARPNSSRLRKETFSFLESENLTAELERNIIITGKDVIAARSGFDQQTNGPEVPITLNMEGGRAMSKATNGNVGRRLGVLLVEQKTKSEIVINEAGEEVISQTTFEDKKIISLATVNDVLGTSFRITGLGNIRVAEELALLIRSGALAAPMKFVEERTIGPSLGKENIQLGVRSIIIGFLAVVLFMLIYYRWFGLAANVALFSNIVLITGFMSLLGATLTLPGMAGIVLTVGMAVDANVLIFSRIKEELTNGSPPQDAIKQGFSRAFVTIFDANVTTLIAALVLYAIGTGPIKGFAVTLSIGIITSMFTAILVTRGIVNLMYGNRNLTRLRV